MKRIDIQSLSRRYDVRRLHLADVPLIHALCQRNMQYYAYCGKTLSADVIQRDLTIAPPGIPMAQKYYVGFFDRDRLIAVMDLIAGYPACKDAYIGFFMMERALQEQGIGSQIISEALAHMSSLGFQKCQLGIDRDNPQSNHFWQKNGFEIIREVALDGGMISVAERPLASANAPSSN